MWLSAGGLGGTALVGIAIVSGVACAYYTRPVREICVPRATATQMTGRLNAIAEHVMQLQTAACKAGRVPKAQCDEQDALRLEMRAAQRDAQAAVMTPGYEMAWDHIGKTIELVGKVLDTVPLP